MLYQRKAYRTAAFLKELPLAAETCGFARAASRVFRSDPDAKLPSVRNAKMPRKAVLAFRVRTHRDAVYSAAWTNTWSYQFVYLATTDLNILPCRLVAVRISTTAQ